LFSSARRSSSQLRKMLFIARVGSCGENVKTKTAYTRWRSWLRHCVTSRKDAGSIPDGGIGVGLIFYAVLLSWRRLSLQGQPVRRTNNLEPHCRFSRNSVSLNLLVCIGIPSIHLWCCSPFRALAFLTRRLHSSLFVAVLLHPLVPSSCSTSL
jgi:hypothetical protein